MEDNEIARMVEWAKERQDWIQRQDKVLEPYTEYGETRFHTICATVSESRADTRFIANAPRTILVLAQRLGNLPKREPYEPPRLTTYGDTPGASA